MFKNVVTSISELRELFGVPMERARLKEHAELDAHCRGFIALSPFVLIATSDATGRCDVSPKGDSTPSTSSFPTGRATSASTAWATCSTIRTSG